MNESATVSKRPITIAAIIAAALPAACITMMLAPVLTSLAHQRGYSSSDVAFAASAEMAGLAAAILAMSWFITVVNRRTFVRVLLLLLVAVDLVERV